MARDWNKQDPVHYFEAHYAGTIKTRGELLRKDQGLYLKLHRIGKLAEVFPERKGSRRNWNKLDPVEVFKREYAGKIHYRQELEHADSGLYEKLRQLKKLEDLLPERAQRPTRDPVQEFREKYGMQVLGRKELQDKEPGLYERLRLAGKIDELLATGRNTRDWSLLDPVAYFAEHYKGKLHTRKDLQRKDQGLYHALRNQGKLDIVFPKKNDGLDDILRDYADGEA